ncbi:MAG: zinc ribbon domain-containing protein [Candidatus Helarchaeota archaeon]|nr:zinc ribbon domain-containing protein [Candidatus Helarchaeota archaeon]
MRHNRGRRWSRRQQKTYSNLNNTLQNEFNRNQSMKIPRMLQKNHNYTYVGRCKCGYGPNAYYKDPNGNVIHANQLIRTSQMNPGIKKSNAFQNSPERVISSQIELYRICNQCGAQVRDDAYFCTECGNELMNSPLVTKKEQIDFLKDKIRDLKTQMKILKKNK